MPNVYTVPSCVSTAVWDRPMATWLTGTPNRLVTTPTCTWGESEKERARKRESDKTKQYDVVITEMWYYMYIYMYVAPFLYSIPHSQVV